MTAFVVVAVAAVCAAVGVITARNVMHSVLWLIAHLCSLAVLYLALQATFLGLVQVLLYAGAVMVLFLFVIGLLTARSQPEPLPREQPSGQLALAVGAGIVVAALLLVGAAGGALTRAAELPRSGWGGAAAFGAALFGPYLLPFEATALALLTAIVGVVALTHRGDEGLAGAGSPAEAGADASSPGPARAEPSGAAVPPAARGPEAVEGAGHAARRRGRVGTGGARQ